uniref:(northern house mosquito) hypothetical protein n=1 Tax=Culex pipiens TaxID=7175 RepID=A0A8D8A6D6_CULPI
MSTRGLILLNYQIRTVPPQRPAPHLISAPFPFRKRRATGFKYIYRDKSIQSNSHRQTKGRKKNRKPKTNSYDMRLISRCLIFVVATRTQQNERKHFKQFDQQRSSAPIRLPREHSMTLPRSRLSNRTRHAT